jgi:hypothetical protein
MRRKIIIGLAVIFIIGCSVYAIGRALFDHMNLITPYPVFMAEIQPKPPYALEEVGQAFAKFIANKFPVGSSAKQTITVAARGGFTTLASKPRETRLIWKRGAGVCNEQYIIVIREDDAGLIESIEGLFRPICL